MNFPPNECQSFYLAAASSEHFFIFNNFRYTCRLLQLVLFSKCMMMAALEEDDDYLEAEDELLNDIVSFSPDVQQAIDQVSKTDGRKGLPRAIFVNVDKLQMAGVCCGLAKINCCTMV